MLDVTHSVLPVSWYKTEGFRSSCQVASTITKIACITLLAAYFFPTASLVTPLHSLVAPGLVLRYAGGSALTSFFFKWLGSQTSQEIFLQEMRNKRMSLPEIEQKRERSRLGFNTEFDQAVTAYLYTEKAISTGREFLEKHGRGALRFLTAEEKEKAEGEILDHLSRCLNLPALFEYQQKIEKLDILKIEPSTMVGEKSFADHVREKFSQCSSYRELSRYPGLLETIAPLITDEEKLIALESAYFSRGKKYVGEPECALFERLYKLGLLKGEEAKSVHAFIEEKLQLRKNVLQDLEDLHAKYGGIRKVEIQEMNLALTSKATELGIPQLESQISRLQTWLQHKELANTANPLYQIDKEIADLQTALRWEQAAIRKKPADGEKYEQQLRSKLERLSKKQQTLFQNATVFTAQAEECREIHKLKGELAELNQSLMSKKQELRELQRHLNKLDTERDNQYRLDLDNSRKQIKEEHANELHKLEQAYLF